MTLTVDYLQHQIPGQFDTALLHELAQVGTLRIIPAGEYLIRPGEYVRSVPIIIRGSVKIMRADREGREVLLYYLGNQDACAMSLTCCLASKPSEVTALAEEETLMLAIPIEKVDDWMGRHQSWRQFVFRTYQRRFDDLLDTIDEITFHKLDERLLTYLQKKAKSCQCVVLAVTHETIAQEMATSREVISRLLKQLERAGHIRLMRNKIAILS